MIKCLFFMWPNLNSLGECFRKTASSGCGPLKKMQAKPSCSQWAGDFLLVSVSSVGNCHISLWCRWQDLALLKTLCGWVWMLLVVAGGGAFLSATSLISISFLLPLLQGQFFHLRSWKKKYIFWSWSETECPKACVKFHSKSKGKTLLPKY